MNARLVRTGILACLIVVLGGCKAYEPRPLEPADVLAAVDRERRLAPLAEESAEAPGDSAEGSGPPPVTLEKAAAWMRRYGPEIKAAVAAYRTALALARVETPLPNPGLEVGPEYGFGDDVSSRELQPFGSLGFTIPLGGKRARMDELNRARAELARIDGVARHRELYLELRRRFVALAVARKIEAARRGLEQAARRSVASARRLVEAGQATALDVALFELELGRTRAGSLHARMESEKARSALASLVGVHGDHFDTLGADDLPDLDQELPALDTLKQALTSHHADLARLRARYEESECALRLEIARQYPDLRIGPSFARETGEDKTTLGLSLGIDLPIFDRNQQGIAEAEERREEIRTRYEARASQALAELERSWRATELAALRHRVLLQEVLPRAQASIQLARESLSAGSGDALRLLDAERSHREILIEVLEAGLREHEAWVDLELATGRPLIPFPSEAGELEVTPPGGLESDRGKENSSGEAVEEERAR